MVISPFRQKEPPPTLREEPSEEERVLLSLGFGVRRISRYRNTSFWVCRFMLPGFT
jgi:hypothetical protein